MFQSHDPSGLFELSSRVLTSVRIMLTDVPGQSDLGLLAKVLGEKKTGAAHVVQSQSGNPFVLPSCVLHLNSSLKPQGPTVKLASKSTAGVLFGLFNAGPPSSETAEMITIGHVREATGEQLEDQKSLVYAHHSRAMACVSGRAKSNDPVMPVRLRGCSSEMLSVVPFYSLATGSSCKPASSVACLGTINHLAGLTTIQALWVEASPEASTEHETASALKAKNKKCSVELLTAPQRQQLTVHVSTSGELGFVVRAAKDEVSWTATVDGQKTALRSQTTAGTPHLRLLTVLLNVPESEPSQAASDGDWTVRLTTS